MSNEGKPLVPKTTTDVQRMKLDKLMKNPDKPVVIPERSKDRKNHYAPEFVRNVMGSSAGAGSGEFHVYRHLRRKEYARQKIIDELSKKDQLDKDYHNKLEENQKKMEAKTAKKRAKRLKKKQRQQNKKTKGEDNETKPKSDSSDSETGDEDENPPEKTLQETNDEEKSECDD